VVFNFFSTFREGTIQESGSKLTALDRERHALDDALSLPVPTPNTSVLTSSFQQHVDLAGKMSEKQKGISLRKKRGDKSRKNAPPTISAPRQISAPMPAGVAAASLPGSGRPSNESSRSRTRQDGLQPQARLQRPDKTADLVKRRYSQKITTLPRDFGNGAPMPQMPAQYRDKSKTREERPPGSSDGRALKVDMRALRDPGLRVEQCEASTCRGQYWHTDCA
jgi:hypothetical protein